MGKSALAGVLGVVFLSGCAILPPLATTPTTVAAIVVPPTATELPVATPPPSPTPARPTATPVPATATPVALVVSAGGDGVFIRIIPEKPDRYKAWADGSTMIVVGDDRTVGGRTWKNVQDPDGNVGWIPDEYLKPKESPTPSPRSPVAPSATPSA